MPIDSLNDIDLPYIMNGVTYMFDMLGLRYVLGAAVIIDLGFRVFRYIFSGRGGG